MKKIFRNSVTVATLLILISLLLSYICEFFIPDKFWIFAFMGLAYPFLLLLALLLCIFWLFTKHKKYSLIILGIIAIGFRNINRTYQFGTESMQNNSDPQLKIMSYNVRLFDLYNWKNNKKTRDKIIQFLRTEQPDVLCIQEFYYDKTNTFNTLDTLTKALGYKFVHTAYITVKNNKYCYGIATFSKYPIAKKENIFFYNSNNHSIISDIIVESDTLRIINNHLESIKLNEDHYKTIYDIKEHFDIDDLGVINIGKQIVKSYGKRMIQADSIGSLIQSSKYRTIVCGDFNDTPISYTYNRICSKNNLKDTFIESGKGLSGTYAGILPALRIDYIFHTNTLTSSEYEVKKIYLSDHFPIVCKIHL